MAQRNSGRIDRFAQMSKQEEIIAKKRQEILEKQRTVQLAKELVAAQNLAAKLKEDENGRNGSSVDSSSGNEPNIVEGEEDIDEKIFKMKKEEPSETAKPTTSFGAKTGKISCGIKRNQSAATVSEQPPPKIQNSFCNDGSFLENFKKILEKHTNQPTMTSALQQSLAASEAAMDEANATANISTESPSNSPTNAELQTPQGVPPPQTTAPTFAFNPHLMAQNMLITSQNQAQDQLQAFFSSAGATPVTTVAATMLMSDPLSQLPISLTNVVPPPPPPPPQIPMALANLAPLYMIPAPEPLQLNAIPAPKDFDLNAIPKPQLNLEAIQMPINEQQQFQIQEQQQQQQQQQQQLEQSDQNQDSQQDNCKQLPTTVDNLIEMVFHNGDDYEDIIRSHKNELHPAMWFLFDKNSEQYHKYRKQLNEYRKCSELPTNQDQHSAIGNTTQQNFSSSDAGSSLSAAAITHNTSKNLRNRTADDTNSVQDEEKYDPESVIGDVDSDDEYLRGMMTRNRDNIKRRIECRNELSEEERQEREAEAEEERRRQEKKKIRKSRWGEKVKLPDDSSSASSIVASVSYQNKLMLTGITRNDPALLQYARQNYGSTNLTEEEWKKCEEHYKVNLLYQDMMRKRQEIDRLAKSGKFKYEYDSDEDVEGGTWEHKLRCAEMEATRIWAQALTKQSEGKHHIGDFLPPEELKKFMEQYEAKKSNRQPDLSDYKEYKLKEDNIGFKMLQKLGWKEGQGLGQDGAGIVDPVNKGPQRDGNQGLGVGQASTPDDADNEYDAYRKRMMLAYRFRPNPLNNPRRAYY